MSSPPETRTERREQARQERKSQEAAAAARAQRSRRLWQLGAVLLAAIVVVGIAIAISSSGGSSTKPPAKGAPASGAAAADALLAGIPQHGNVLGNPKAPVTLQEFADLQCPICQAYTQDSLPTLIRNDVRTGRVKMVFHHLPILGPDSQRAAQVAGAAAQQNRLWNFIEVFYANQGTENTGYVTPTFLTKVARAAGVNPTTALAQPPTAAVKSQLSADQALSNKYAFNGTPSFLLGKTGGTPQPLTQVDVTSPNSFTGPINSLLGQ